MTSVLLRVVGFLALIVIGASMVTFLVTKDRRWLRFGWQVLKYSLILGLIFLAFLALERLVLAL
jgi:multisubunit Na+/H+ antiporter MnhB subunit